MANFAVFEMAGIAERQRQAGEPYLEFLRVPALRTGLYVLPAGAVDDQQPHQEDEIYYVLGGRGAIWIADRDHAVQPGAVIYVAAGVVHYFHGITEELRLLVFFART